MDKTNEFRLFEIKNRIKQAIQGNIMYGLSKDGFFDMAALHGDKARRLQYDLEGFSGHLEFTLFKSDPDFKIESLLPSIERELADNGLEFKVEGLAWHSVDGAGTTLPLKLLPVLTIGQSEVFGKEIGRQLCA